MNNEKTVQSTSNAKMHESDQTQNILEVYPESSPDYRFSKEFSTAGDCHGNSKRLMERMVRIGNQSAPRRQVGCVGFFVYHQQQNRCVGHQDHFGHQNLVELSHPGTIPSTAHQKCANTQFAGCRHHCESEKPPQSQVWCSKNQACYLYF